MGSVSASVSTLTEGSADADVSSVEVCSEQEMTEGAVIISASRIARMRRVFINYLRCDILFTILYNEKSVLSIKLYKKTDCLYKTAYFSVAIGTEMSYNTNS